MIITDRPGPSHISPKALLAIPSDRPERLFSGDDAADRVLYRRLAREVHPDLHPEHAKLFKHLSELRRARDARISAGTWNGGGVHEIQLRGGKRLRVRFRRRVPFELGTLLIGRNSLTYLVREEHGSLFEAGVARMEGFRYADVAMRKEMSRVLPTIQMEDEAEDGHVLVLAKTPDVVRLRDVLDHHGGCMDPRHVAWILSTLHNMGAYLHWAGLTHNALDLDTYFISPQNHSGLLLGGWWYAREVGEPVSQLPATSAALWKSALPAAATRVRRATPLLDRELVRNLGRCLLGDPGGSRLLRDSAVPRALAEWLTTPGDPDGIRDYHDWAQVRARALGPRKFVSMDVTPDAVYGAH
jgi:hypothetical protein